MPGLSGRSTFAEQLRRLAAKQPPPRRHDGDASPWSREPRGPADGADPALGPDGRRVPYAELHCRSNFSFLDGVSHPEELVGEAVRLGLDALVLADRDGMHGAVRLAQAARAHGLPVGHGAELSLDLPGEQAGVPDPAGTSLLAIARDLTGYRRLCGAISRAALAGGKNAPVYDLDATVEDLRGHVLVPTGGRRGHVRRALVERGTAAAADALRDLVDWFGADHVVVELTDHQHPLDSEHNDVLAGLAAEHGLPVAATTNARYAAPDQAPHANLVDAIRAHRTLDDMQPWLGPGTAFLRSGAEMHDMFARYPGAVATSARLGREVAFDLRLLAPALPPFPVPDGFPDEADYLRHLAYAGAADRYGPRDHNPDAYAVIDRELAVIEELGFPGYFLTVWDIVRFARESGILAQGRGSAATSAVCYALRISNVDAVKHQLLFERFLNTERREPPDIDVFTELDLSRIRPVLELEPGSRG